MDVETDIIFESEEEKQVKNEHMFTSDDKICVVNKGNELVHIIRATTIRQRGCSRNWWG